MRRIVVRAFIPTLSLAILATAGLAIVVAAQIIHGNMWLDGGILNA